MDLGGEKNKNKTHAWLLWKVALANIGSGTGVAMAIVASALNR
jgi:hypothetical protein